MRSQDLSNEAIFRLGQEIYERRLQTLLEPQKNGFEIAICVEDDDCELAETRIEADFRLRKRHPDAVFYLRRVGPVYAVRW